MEEIFFPILIFSIVLSTLLLTCCSATGHFLSSIGLRVSNFHGAIPPQVTLKKTNRSSLQKEKKHQNKKKQKERKNRKVIQRNEGEGKNIFLSSLSSLNFM